MTYESIKLGDLVEEDALEATIGIPLSRLRAGRSNETERDSETTIRVLNARCVLNNRFEFSSSDYESVPPDKLAGKDEFRTQLNDIIVKLSPPNEAAMVRSGDTGIFVSSSCMIVRVTNPDVIDPHYLAGWLTSPMGKGILGNGEVLRRGTFLTKTIPFPPIEKQREAGTTFSNILDATENILNIQDLLGETQTSTFLEFYDKDSPHES